MPLPLSSPGASLVGRGDMGPQTGVALGAHRFNLVNAAGDFFSYQLLARASTRGRPRVRSERRQSRIDRKNAA
jgi:hypothetical protein